MLCLVAQWCPTLGDPMDCSLPGSSVHRDSPGKNTGVNLSRLQKIVKNRKAWHAVVHGVTKNQTQFSN